MSVVTVSAAIAAVFGMVPARAAEDPALPNELMLAVPYAYGSQEAIAPQDAVTYGWAQRFIAILNELAPEPRWYGNPQVGTPIDTAAAILTNDVDAAFLPYPMYAAVEHVRLSDLLEPLAVVPAAESVMVGNAAACVAAAPISETIAGSFFITGNEYDANSRLEAKLLFARLGVRPKILRNAESTLEAVSLFQERANGTEPTVYLTDLANGRAAAAVTADACLLGPSIPASWPSFVFAVNKRLHPSVRKLIADGVAAINADRPKYLPLILGSDRSNPDLVERVKNFIPAGADAESILRQSRQTLEQNHLDPRAFFGSEQLRQRLEQWAKDGSIAFVLPPTDARVAYALGAAAETIGALRQNGAADGKSALIGSSGGSMGALVLALAPDLREMRNDVIQQALDPALIIRPLIRYKLLLFLFDRWYVTAALTVLLLAVFFYSPVVLWSVSLLRHHQRRNFLIAIAFLIASFIFLPPISLETAAAIVIGSLIMMAVLFFLPRHSLLNLLAYAMPVVAVIVSVVAIRTVFQRNALLDQVAMEGPLRKLAAAAPPLEACAALADSNGFSRCLFDRLQYPIIIITSDIYRDQQVFFYANLKPEAGFVVPRKGKWVDLSTCPENLVRVTEASASFPIVFPPIPLECAGEPYLLSDGALFSAGIFNVATQIGAATAITFMNEPFSPQRLIGVVGRPVEEQNLLVYLENLIQVVIGRNLYAEFQANIPAARQVVFTPSTSSFILPNYRYLGIKQRGVNYTQQKIYAIGRDDAGKDDLFFQLSGSELEFDSFAKRLTP